MTQRPPAQSGNDSGGTSAEQSAVAQTPETTDFLLELVQKSYRPLSAEEQERLRTTIGHLQVAAAAMQAYPLTNADEPDPIFRVYRAD